jgi:hypothetical protein
MSEHAAEQIAQLLMLKWTGHPSGAFENGVAMSDILGAFALTGGQADEAIGVLRRTGIATWREATWRARAPRCRCGLELTLTAEAKVAIMEGRELPVRALVEADAQALTALVEDVRTATASIHERGGEPSSRLICDTAVRDYFARDERAGEQWLGSPTLKRAGLYAARVKHRVFSEP